VTSEWDPFLGLLTGTPPPGNGTKKESKKERVTADTGEPGWNEQNFPDLLGSIATPSSLGYPLTVFNKNSTLEKRKEKLVWDTFLHPKLSIECAQPT